MARTDGPVAAAPGFTVPVLGHSGRPNDTTGIIVGMGDLTLDGAPFPWPTVGDWTLRFEENGIAVLHLGIAVSLPKDPAA